MRFLIVCVLTVLLACILLAQSKTTQKSPLEKALQSAVVAYEERSLTTPQAFRASLNLSRAPGGIVTISGCQENKLKKNWKPQGQTLGEVLNNIVSADRNYRWETQDDAINLLPSGGEPPLLRTHIGEFSVTTKSSLDALNELQNRPEVKAAMTSFNLKGGLTIVMYSPSTTDFSVRFKGGTLRQALNAIAVSRGTDIWDYTETRCGKKNDVTIRF